MKIPMRRRDRKLSDEEAMEILGNGEYGILSFCSMAGEPYGIPLNYALDDKNIYFHCAMEGSKINFLNANSRVSFCVVGETEVLPSDFSTRYESVIVSGNASFIGGDEKKKALIKLVEKYSADFTREGLQHIKKNFDRTGVFKLEIGSVSGKSKK